MRIRLILLGLLSVTLIACEGPMGPGGRPGPRGRTGPAGAPSPAGFILELIASEDAWEVNGWPTSYVFYNEAITTPRVIEVYLKKYYTNTGDVYYEPLDHWIRLYRKNVSIQLIDGGIRFWDPDKTLQNQIIVISLRS